MDAAIAEMVEGLKADPKVSGVLLVGSRARGDHLPDADLDLWVLLREVLERRFRAEAIGSYWVETHFRNFSLAKAKMQQSPIEVYAYLDGQILHDPDLQLAQLVEFAQQQFEAYQQPEAERKELAYWLSSLERKLRSALPTQDPVRLGYLASTHAWKVLEGLWAANQRPMPPSGTVGKHLGHLELPMPASELAHGLFAAPPEERAKTALELIRWSLPRIQ